MGSAIPNSEIKIVDDGNRELPERHVGEIFVRSKTLFRGYFDAPDETRERYAPGVSSGGHDDGARGFRYLEWHHDPDPDDETAILASIGALRGEVVG